MFDRPTSMTESGTTRPPSAFVMRWATRVAAVAPRGARALDLASGHGRHAVALANAGFRVTALDIQLDSLRASVAAARALDLSLSAVCADATVFPLPREYFHVVVVTRYLDRALFPALRASLHSDGVLLYETFTERQLQHGRGPRSPQHLLAPGELRTLVRGMDVLFDEEVTVPDAVARIAARQLGSSSRVG
jgi:SAM-dependent methyltransferase